MISYFQMCLYNKEFYNIISIDLLFFVFILSISTFATLY